MKVGRLGKEIPRDLDNGQNKLDWAADELLLATYVSKKSTLDVLLGLHTTMLMIIRPLCLVIVNACAA